MNKEKKESPIGVLWGWGKAYHGKFIGSIVLAVLGVACQMVPYFCVAHIVTLMLSGERDFFRYIVACVIALCGYLGKVIFSNLSTTISHTATYYTLRDLRENITAKLARVPMGTILDTPSGQYKTTIVDRVEGMEPTFAHLIPEMTANVLVPLVIVVYLFILDWRMALLSLVTLVIGLVVMSAGMKNYPVKWEGAVKAGKQMANAIDDTPVMDEKGSDITPKSSEIVFDKVDFSYADRKILDQVSFTIPEKTTTAIVGPSGAGKTTMCNLIARFWDVNAGKITIGGTDVRDFKLDSLMKNISMVFQSVYLFADTVENNIKFGCPDATHEQVVEAAKKACCHDFISALPNGYDTVIGEGGGTLSGGEKQRISIARAMLKNAPIIILDEATSSVDPENEDELQRAIEALTHDKTIIMIAHRLKTVRNADQILVLNNAHIVQRGTHAELIQQKGLYADFVSARQEAIGWKLAQ